VLLGEPLLVHTQELLDVLADEPKERRLFRTPRPIDSGADLHADAAAGWRATGDREMWTLLVRLVCATGEGQHAISASLMRSEAS
jgi:hypothetical protein